ncbi:MAG: antimicrobial resistance protein Mig-14 [Zoogloeaceae bacterium]|jgi:hypothetical protein|nr:antimicrobial resistance protein Mig-14 [Zoogloeaceae bacterium]
MLNRLAFFRERGWVEISAADYAEIWQRYGGSVLTHPEFVARLSMLAGIPPRYLGWRRDETFGAALPVWGRHLALSGAALKARGKKRIFDLGSAEVILPVCGAARDIPLRHSISWLSGQHENVFSGLAAQKERLALLKPPERFSAKFCYNQRRALKQFENAGGTARPLADFSPDERAAMYLDLFSRRWGFPAAGAARMAEAFSLLSDWMTGSVLFLAGAPVAVQILYRVESPRWISVEYINGGVAPEARDFSVGSVLIYLNTEAARQEASAKGKTLRYSFGRMDAGYKALWCRAEPVFRAGSAW